MTRKRTIKPAPETRPALFVEQLIAAVDMERLAQPIGFYDIVVETPTGSYRPRAVRWEHATEPGADWRPTMVIEAT